MKKDKILIIGASGFIGSNLLRALEKENHLINVLARTPEKVFTNSENTKVFKGDLDKPETIKDSLIDVGTIYYLAHSMNDDQDEFLTREVKQAKNLSEYLKEDQSIIYLGGIIPKKELSTHLKSRLSVGEVFKDSKAKAIEFRASIVIGKGSASYEMIRALVHRLPFIVTAKWASADCQPIALENVIDYLIQAKDLICTQDEVFNIGGDEILTYKDLILRYAEHKGYRRPEIYIEDFPIKLAQEIMKIIIPEYATISGHLLGSIELDTIVTDHHAKDKFKDIKIICLSDSFDKASGETLEKIPVKEILQKLKAHKELPQYFTGQSLQMSFQVPEGFDFEKHVNTLNEIMPQKLKRNNPSEVFFKIPFIGEFKISFIKDNNELLTLYKPKYFFQSMGWVLFSELVKKIESFRK
jgi:uncharacterized protein YbjT (DUF2867 family)